MYFIKSPWWLKRYYNALTWNIPATDKTIYFTFDDGPHATITPFVLDVLKEYNAKATFFCLGKNVRSNSNVYKRIIEEGHSVGNHSYNHLNGWNTDDSAYIKNIIVAREYIDSRLFRPPYGRITKFQIKQLKDVFNIIMWDVLSADFDIKITPEQCLTNVIKNVSPGSIVVFHDSEKAFPRLKHALPKALDTLSKEGYTFKAIPQYL